MIQPVLHSLFEVEKEDFYCSILPTATQYARNAIFAGLMPAAIDKIMPDLWLNDDEEGGKNQHEEDFLRRQIQSQGKGYSLFFDKIVKTDSGKRLIENIDKVHNADFSVIVYNFLDILSHARTETQIIRDLAEDEAAFRSLTRSWFEHSDLLELMRLLAERGHTIIITSDHGTIQVDNPVRVQGDRATSSNLRYKTGRNLGFNQKEVFAITKPEPGAPAEVEHHVDVHFRLQPRFLRLSEQYESVRPLLQQYVPARRHFDGRDDRAVPGVETSITDRLPLWRIPMNAASILPAAAMLTSGAERTVWRCCLGALRSRTTCTCRI